MTHVAFLSTYPAQDHVPVGGVQAASVRLVAALASRGISVTVIAGGLSQSYESDGVRVLGAPLDDRRALLSGFGKWRRSAHRLLDDLDVDIVHGQGLIPGGLAVSDVEGLPRVVTAQGNVVRDTLAAYHGIGKWPRALLGRRLASIATSRADVVVAAHPQWRWNVPTKPRSFVYIPTVVEDVFFRARREPTAGSVLFCGGGRRIKGFDVLARAWPRIIDGFRGARLTAVGWSGSEEYASDPRLDSCEIQGWLEPKALARTMEAASIIVIPSRFDVAPLALAEAWAARVPVVATSVGGLGALAAGAALLVPPEDPVALAEAVVSVLTGALDVTAYVAEGVERAQAWRAEAVVSAHIELYSRVLR